MFGINRSISAIACMIVFMLSSCVAQKGSFEGNFQIDGFTYDVFPPEIRLNTASAIYTNQTNVPLFLVTGAGKQYCDTFTHYTVTETPAIPQIADINQTCNGFFLEPITYTLIDTADGQKTLYSWGGNKTQNTISVPYPLTIILDRTAPTGTLAAPSALEKGGDPRTLAITTADNFQLSSVNLAITNDNGATWTALSSPSTSAISSSFNFPAWDTNNARIRMTMTDAAGNIGEVSSTGFIIDSTAPVMTIENLPAAVAGGLTTTITFTGSDLNGLASTTLEFSADGGSTYSTIVNNPTSPYTWTIPNTPTAQGMIRLTGVDNAGNSSSVTTALFAIDDQPPVVNLTVIPNPLKGGAAHNITWTATDPSGIAGASLEYAADGINYTLLSAAATSPYAWSVPATNTTGSKIRLTVTDNTTLSTTVVSNLFNIDITPPSLTLADFGSTVLRGGTPINIDFTRSDANGVASISLDYAADGVNFTTNLTTTNVTPFSWSVPVTNTTGSKIRLTVTDNAGNSASVTNAAFNIDSTAPSLTLTDLPAVIRGGIARDVFFTNSDANGIASISLDYAADGVNFSTNLTTTNSSPFNWAVPGSNTTGSKLRLTVTDNAGISSIVTSAPFNIDSTAPTLTLFDVGPLLKGGDVVNVNFITADSNGVASISLDYAVDGVNFTTNLTTTNTSPFSWTVPADNTAVAKLRLTVTDIVGNSASVTNNAFTIDSTPPTLNLPDLGVAAIKGGLARDIFFSNSDSSGIASISLDYAADGVTFSTQLTTTNTSPFSWNVPAVDTTGSKLRLTVVDNAGNSASVTNAAFNIDSTPPTLNLPDLGVAAIKGGLARDIPFTRSDANGIGSISLDYAADGVTFSTNLTTTDSSPYSWSVPAVNTTGSKLRLTVTDSVGNSASVTNAAFNIDSAGPSVTLDDLGVAAIKGGLARDITFTNSDPNGVASISLDYAADGVTFGTQLTTINSSPYSWAVPAVDTTGSKLRLTVTDNVGNSTVVTNAAFNIDSTPPTLNLPDLGVAAIKGGLARNIPFTRSDANGIGSISLDYAADGVTFSTNLTTTDSSPYNWAVPLVDTTGSKLRLTVTDSVGNSASMTNAAFNIDKTPPNATLTDLASLLMGTTPVGVYFTNSDTNGVASISLDYAQDGTNFTTNLTTVNSSPYAWTLPAHDTTASKLRLTVTDAVGNITVLTSAPFIIDSTGPSVTLADLAPVIRGGSAVDVNFTATDTNGVASIVLKYAADGVTFSTTLSSSPGPSPYSWTTPVVDTTGSKLQLIVTDNIGNVTTVTNAAFNLDKTPPALPGVTLTSNDPSNSQNITITVADCTDRAAVFVNEGTQPAYNDVGWQTCVTTASAITYTIAATEVTHNLKVWAKDAVGNVTATASPLSMVYDVTPPVITVTSPANLSYAKNSVVMTGACEIGSNIDFSGDVAAAFSIACSTGTWTQTVNFLDPGIDGNKVITVAQTDPAGNTASVVRTYINDNLPPVITRTSPASPILTNTNSVSWIGTCEGTYTINVTGDATESFACASNAWSWTSPTMTVDGTYNFSFTQTDAAGNVSTALPLQWTRDQTPPTFTSDRTSPETNNKSSLNFTGSCEGTNAIVITGSATDTISCSAGNWNWTTPVVSVDGTYNYTFTQTDPAGNTSVINHQWTRDTTGPAILVDLDKELIKTNLDSVTITGTCDMTPTDSTITITGTDSTTIACVAGLFSYTTVAQVTDATRVYNFSQTNDLLTTTTVSSTVIRETNLPTISAVSKGAGVQEPSRTNFIDTNLTASSANVDVGIAEFCFLSNNSTKPGASDECWVKVNSPQVGLSIQQNLNLVGYSNLLGWQPVFYTVYAFVKDEAGNISDLTNAGAGTLGVDIYTATYDPGIPPVVSDVIAANSDVTNNPPTLGEMNVPAGTDVYIRWKATDNAALPAGAITLKYTQDEISFVPITLTDPADPANPAANFTGLDNANYGCPGVVLGADEGCYKWTGGSPLNSTYKIQVVVKDVTDIEVKSISNPLNTGNIKILAGNTESGLGGAAEAAMFYVHPTNWDIDRKTMVVTDSGDLYFADEKRGILTIDRADGKQKIFIPTTGASTGDGGVATAATLIFPTRITLDYQNRLLILDRNKIRRVDLNQNPPTIETLIGGGADTSDTVNDPLQVYIYPHGNDGWTISKIPFFAMPNGDIIFMSEDGDKYITEPNLRFRIYKAASGQVISKYIVKDGVSTDTGNYYHDVLQPAAVDLSFCRVSSPNFRFDPLTSQITGIRTLVMAHATWPGCERTDGNLADTRYTTAYFDPVTLEPMDHSVLDEWASYASYHQVTGMDGNLYLAVGTSYIDRINFDGTHTRVLGSGTQGSCVDGTPALSCNMIINDVFITASGKFYFLDAGAIRTVENGNVVTLAGQKRSYGDGVNALNARLDNPNWFARKNDGKITYADAYYFKEFTVEGNVNVIAGNGNYASYQAVGVDARTTGFYSHDWWEMDPVTGNVYARYYAFRTAMLDRSVGEWTPVIGGGTITYWSNDGDFGAAQNSSYYVLPIGIDHNGHPLISHMKYNSVEGHYEDFMWKSYDPADNFRQTHVAGTNDPAKTYVGGYYGMIDGATTADNKVPYYSYTSAMSWDSVDGKWIGFNYAHNVNNSNGKQVWAITPGGTFSVIATLARQVQFAYVHVRYAGKEWLYYRYGGRIYYHDLTTDTDMGQLLPWNVPTMNVQGYKLIYNPTNHSIIFAMNQNGLGGIAEYFLPP